MSQLLSTNLLKPPPSAPARGRWHGWRYAAPARVLGLCLTLWAGLCTPGSVAALSEVSWLYEVEQDVPAQTVEARHEAAQLGLLTVLTRVTGLASVPRTDEVTAALESVDQYYGAYVFLERTGPEGEPQQYLRLSFDADAVLALVRNARLPVWWSQRPSVLAWLVLDDGTERRLLGGDETHPLLQALQQHARARGLSISVPVLDLSEQVSVSAADVWGKLRADLDIASERYAPDLVLVGRFSLSRRGVGVLLDEGDVSRYRGDWEVWLGDEPLVAEFSDRDAAGAVAMGVDELANRLAERYAVLPRAPGLHTFTISQLNTVAAYAELMNFLGTLEFVDQIDVVAVQGGKLQLHLGSRADFQQLLMLLTEQDRLRVDELHMGLDTQLIWRG